MLRFLLPARKQHAQQKKRRTGRITVNLLPV